MGELKDPNGKYLFRAFVDVAKRQGKGFVEYQWPRPGSVAPVDKALLRDGLRALGLGARLGHLRGRPAHRAASARDLRGGGGPGGAAAGRLPVLLVLQGDGRRQSEVRRYLNAIAQGDLTHRPRAWGNDEAAWLLNDLSTMQDSLSTVVARVRASSDRIVQSSDEVAQGALGPLYPHGGTASNLAQSAASMDQISTTVTNGSGLIATAADVARRNAGTAAEGGTVMSEVASTMEEIRSASARIADIIGTIDGIAFQTNILALNAAVKRHAPVSRVVALRWWRPRCVHSRSAAQAPPKIKTLIQSNVESVESGTQTVRRAAGTIKTSSKSPARWTACWPRWPTARASKPGHPADQHGRAAVAAKHRAERRPGRADRGGTASMKQLADALSDEVSRFRLPEASAG